MKAVKNWQLLRQNPDGITLLCDNRHLLHIIVLEQHLWRIWLLQEGKSRLDRTWTISPETAPTPDIGRRRASREGFTCPPVVIVDNGDHVILEGDTIRLTVTKPLMLSWAEKTPTGWRALAADRKTDAYMLGHSRTQICHYLRLLPEDKYFGLGEKAGTVNRFGKRYEMRSVDAMGYNAETSDPLYKHWPFYHTVTASGGHYGMFYDNLNNAWFNLGKEIDNYHGRFRSYIAEDGDLDYYFIHGKCVDSVTRRFIKLTGRHVFPPKWSLGYSGSTMSYTDAPDAQTRLQQFIHSLDEHAIPCDSFQLSSGYTSIADKRYVFHWNRNKIPEPEKLIACFRKAGIRVIANIKPCLLEDHPKYREVAARGLFIHDSEQNAPEHSRFWDGEGSYLDFTNPETVLWWNNQIRESLLKYGISSTWNDNNEYEIQDRNARCHGFGDAIAIHPIRALMPLLMLRSAYQAQREYCKERPYLISRSGCPGMQRYGQTWSGDNHTSWHTLKWNIRMGVGLSLSGMYHLGHDIGGFTGSRPDPELFLRWIQSALLLPRFTIHSWNDDHSANEPWMHPQVLPAVREAITLRYHLLPYLYTLLWETSEYDAPFLRATFLDHETDPHTFDDTDDYMIGAHLLLCPVTASGQRHRDCYLPDNTLGWYDYYQGNYHCGGQTLTMPAPLERLLIFVRAGSIIPEGRLLHGDSAAQDNLRILRIFPPLGHQRLSGTIFDDDGNNSKSKDYRLHWILSTTASDIHLELHSSGDYRPAYLDNFEVTVPQQERRTLSISGNVLIHPGDAS